MSTTARDPHQRVLDKHGFNPDDFEWRPVPRRPRRDGWTAEVQRKFIDVLASTGLVEEAARAVEMSKEAPTGCAARPGPKGSRAPGTRRWPPPRSSSSISPLPV